MLLDYHILNNERSVRRERGAPRFYDVGPVMPNILGQTPEQAQQAEAEQRQKASAESQKAPPKQPQQTQPTQQPKAQTMDRAAREDRADDRRGAEAQHHTEGQALKDASKQGVKELLHSEFVENQPQVHTGSAFRAPSTGGGSVLQNIRVITGEAHPDKTPLAARSDASPAQARDTGGRASTSPEARGLRLADFTRQGGIQEHGRLHTPGSFSDPRTSRMPLGRGMLPQSQPFRPDSPFARLADRALTRSWNPDGLTTLLNQAARNLPESHAALSNRAANVAVVMHGSLIFVRDGDKIRSFRLLSDGTLHETNQDGEHTEGGPPLSREARSELSRLLRQKGIHARLHGEKESIGETRDEAKAHALKDRSLNARGELRSLTRDDSSFAHLLKQVLEEGSSVGEYLNEGEDAQFAEKSDWQGFFGRMLGLGSEEKAAKKTFDEVMGFIFRGLFKKKEGKGETLVSDIQYELSGKSKEMKFARIDVLSEELGELLKNLKPGQTISKEMLKRFFGEEISFTELIHVIQKSDPILASEIMKSIKFDPQAAVDPFSQARLEHHIFSKSRRRPGAGGFGTGGENASPNNGGAVLANAFDLQQKEKREVTGKAKLYTFITYTAIVFGVLLLLFFLLGK